MNKVYLGIITVLACACICAGQNDTKQRPSSVKDDNGRSVQTSLASGTSLNAELQKTIDVNRSKVGDTVILKTTQSVKQDGEIVIPKGTNLVGRVTDVQRRTKDNALSRIGIVFDSLQGKQLSMPLTATIVSITNAGARSQVDDSLMADSSAGSRTTASTTSGGSGGLLGGVTGTLGSVVNTTTQTVGTVTNTAAGTVGPTLRGLQISTSASGSANGSTTLSSTDKNLRVEKGANFHVRIAN